MDVVRVSRQLGHSNANITLGTYAHCFREADREAAEVMSKVLR
jgi:integrase